MRVSIREEEPLLAISPAALSAYARSAGWRRTDRYGESSDIYVSDDLPEIILPRTQRLGDYANVVSRLIEIFAEAADRDELSLYRDLVTADRDVIRVRASEGNDGAIRVSEGIDLVCGAYEMVLAAACSLRAPQPVYRAGANREAMDYVGNIRLGQTEQGSFVVTLLSPVVCPPMQEVLPIERQMTKRLASALRATREAAERAAGGDTKAFPEAVERGASANLCEALVRLIEPFPTLDVSLTWARTHPMNRVRDVIRFGEGHAPILREAARLFRDRSPRADVHVVGFVHRLKREEGEVDGTITLRAYIDEQGQELSVAAVLSQEDYERAIQAHKERALVVAQGDLERYGQRWRLLNPRIEALVPLPEETTDEE